MNITFEELREVVWRDVYGYPDVWDGADILTPIHNKVGHFAWKMAADSIGDPVASTVRDSIIQTITKFLNLN